MTAGSPRPAPLCLLLVLAAAWLAAGPAAARPEARGVRDFCVILPMRDGTRLATDVYLPRFPRGMRWPIILVRTPENKNEITRLMARYVCRRGYGLVVQDTRGRHASQGGPTLTFLDDGWGENRDGHDTIRWIARQDWCSGRVGMWGASAIGFTAALAAPDAPDALRAQHVMMSFTDMYAQAAYQGGALRKELVEGWLRTHRYHPINHRHVLAHYKYDAFWEQLSPVREAHRVNAPAVFWGGWHDVFVEGAIDGFTAIQEQGGPRARGNCRLIVGPWSHNDLRQVADPRNAACYPRAGEAVRFFDYWLRGVPGGVPCDRPVHYYVMGSSRGGGNRWRSAEGWPPPSRPTSYYLRADGALGPEPPPDDDGDARRTYRYDPGNPVPTLGGRNLYLRAGPVDQRAVEARDDVLLFTGEPLDAPLETTGRVVVELFVSSDCPDTDFTVKLSDVHPDGRSMLVCDGIRRARFRESFAEEKFLEPGEVYRVEVDLWSTSHVFAPGHRLRVAVSSSNAPRFEPNPNNGDPHPDGPNPPRVATNTVYLSRERASRIVLPVCPPGG
jgi:uncharacterized protein